MLPHREKHYFSVENAHIISLLTYPMFIDNPASRSITSSGVKPYAGASKLAYTYLFIFSVRAFAAENFTTFRAAI